MKKAKKVAERTGVREKIKLHRAHYGFRAGLAVWVVVAYCMMQDNPFSFSQPNANVEEVGSNHAM